MFSGKIKFGSSGEKDAIDMNKNNPRRIIKKPVYSINLLVKNNVIFFGIFDKFIITIQLITLYHLIFIDKIIFLYVRENLYYWGRFIKFNTW